MFLDPFNRQKNFTENDFVRDNIQAYTCPISQCYFDRRQESIPPYVISTKTVFPPFFVISTEGGASSTAVEKSPKRS